MTAPDGVNKVFFSETQFGLVIYRTQLFNSADINNVKKIQAGYTAKPLSAFLHQAAPPVAPAPDFPVFTEEAFKTDFPRFLNFLLQYCPPVPEENDLRAKFAEVGIEAGKPFDTSKLSEAEKAELGLGVKDGFDTITKSVANFGKEINGWRLALPRAIALFTMATSCCEPLRRARRGLRQ